MTSFFLAPQPQSYGPDRERPPKPPWVKGRASAPPPRPPEAFGGRRHLGAFHRRALSPFFRCRVLPRFSSEAATRAATSGGWAMCVLTYRSCFRSWAKGPGPASWKCGRHRPGRTPFYHDGDGARSLRIASWGLRRSVGQSIIDLGHDRTLAGTLGRAATKGPKEAKSVAEVAESARPPLLGIPLFDLSDNPVAAQRVQPAPRLNVRHAQQTAGRATGQKEGFITRHPL